MVIPCCSAAGRTRSTASAIDQVHRHVVAPGLLVGLDAGELEEVVDGAADAERLGEHALGQAVGDGGVVLGQQRLGEQRQGADGRLQLVADVGDEVAAHRLEAAPVGDVVDDHEHAEPPAVRRQRDGREHEGAAGWAEQVDGARREPVAR